MGSKKVTLILVGIVAVAAIFFFIKPKTSSVEPLRFCTWSNYYPEAFIQEFTQKTGIPVEMSYISSNEELLAKFKAGASGFDLIQPSDYLVGQMVKLDMLQPLNHAEISNLGNIDAFFTNLTFDPGMKYSVPFTWGTTGIVVNTEKVKLPAGDVSWAILYDSPDAKHTSLLDDMREVFAGLLLWRGQSMNTTDVALLQKTKEALAKVKSKVLLFSSEPRALMEKGEINIGHIFSFDGISLAKADPKYRYLIPKEGATIYTDNFSIPKSSTRTKEAHIFINHFLDSDVGRRMSLETHMATPNRVVKASLPKEVTDDPALYPPAEVMKRLHFLEDLGPTLSILSKMWTELKST